MKERSESKKMSISKASVVVRIVVFAAIVISAIIGLGLGSPSAFGWEYISLFCPLGALETIFGTWSFVPRLLIVTAVVIAAAFLVGRAFCSWVCPVQPLGRFFKSKKEAAEDARMQKDALAKADDGEKAVAPCAPRKYRIDSRHVVLLGAIGSAAVFGFPVFCLICPIGLSIATIVLLVQLVGFNDPSWGLLIFPLILLVELVVLKKWCVKICPVGALLSIVSARSKSFKPRIDHAKCLRSTGAEQCGRCSAVCPELIDPHSDKGIVAIAECTRCHACAEVCPQGALDFPLWQRGTKSQQQVVPSDTTESSDVESKEELAVS